MKHAWLVIGMVVAGVTPLHGAGCVPEDQRVIKVETKCSETGIELTNLGDDKSAFACLTDSRFVRTCGPDGRMPRLKAFSEWLRGVKQFQQSCEDSGGIFGYVDPGFTEPTNESFCENARIVTKPGYFEQTMCNALSTCGEGVSVKCTRSCTAETTPADFRVYSSQTDENRYTVRAGEPGPSMLRSN